MGPGAAPLPDPAPPTRDPAATAAVGAPCPDDRRQTVLDAVNLIRTDRGLDALRPDARLQAAALAHARDLAEHGLRGHEGSDGSSPAERATAAGYPWVLVGENVARGYVSASAVVSGWMASPPHRANLLTPDHQEAGVAWADGPSTPNPVWVLVLGRSRAVPVGPPGCVGDPGQSGDAGGS